MYKRQVQLDTHFVESGKIGEVLTCRPRVVRSTRSLIFVSAEVTVDKRCIAMANGVFKILKLSLIHICEELGLEPGPEDVLGMLDDYPTRSGYLITPVVVWAEGCGTISPNPDEVASVHRIALDDICLLYTSRCV